MIWKYVFIIVALLASMVIVLLFFPKNMPSAVMNLFITVMSVRIIEAVRIALGLARIFALSPIRWSDYVDGSLILVFFF